MMYRYVRGLTLEGFFHIHLLKVESFYVLIKNLIFRGEPTSMICDGTNSLEANPGPIVNLQKCDVENKIMELFCEKNTSDTI